MKIRLKNQKSYVLISILPKWADQILSGTKKWEYRRVVINAEKGSKLILYASGKLHAIVGEATIEKVLIGSVDLLIQHTAKEVLETSDELKKAFAGKKIGCAIKVEDPIRYSTPLSLSMIRKEIPNFKPPQSFYYILDDSPLMRLLTKVKR
jgi:predicted transcriptional regulator